MYHRYELMGYAVWIPVYSNGVWNVYPYNFGSNQDPPNLILAGGPSWSNDFDFAHNRNGTGVFLPKLEHGTVQHGTGVFHPQWNPQWKHRGYPNRLNRVANVVNPNQLIQERNAVFPNRLNRLSNPVYPNRVSNVVYPNRLNRASNHVYPNRVDRVVNLVSIDALPDEVQELILTFLPLPSVFEASCVCKKWDQIVHSGKFKIHSDGKPWYFMFTISDWPASHIHDPVNGYWYDFKFPVELKSSMKIAASSGLICLMEENDCNFEIYICNPMTRKCRKIEQRIDSQVWVYSNLAFSVDQPSHEYTIAIVRSWPVYQDSLSPWYISVHIYNSVKMTWLPPFVENLGGWIAKSDGLIFDGVLYLGVKEFGMTNRHALLSYNLKSLSSDCNLIKTLTPIPFPLTCIRLMYVQNKLVMVGGLGRHDVPEKIGIWMLKGTEWEEVSFVPQKFIRNFKELDDVFASSGAGDLIYIQTYGARTVIAFDFKSKVWRWCYKSPKSNRSPFQLFSGFCFEPRLDISP